MLSISVHSKHFLILYFSFFYVFVFVFVFVVHRVASCYPTVSVVLPTADAAHGTSSGAYDDVVPVN